MVDLNMIAMKSGQYFIAKDTTIKETTWLWHHRLGYASMHTLSKSVTKDLFKSLPKLNFKNDHVYDAYQFGKQTRKNFKSKNIV